jgi:hypothetical protein
MVLDVSSCSVVSRLNCPGYNISTRTTAFFYCCLRIRCCRNMFTASLHRNGCTRYIAPSLRLFVTNGLQAYCHFVFSEGCASDISDRSHLSPCGSVYRVFTLQLLLLPFHRVPVGPGVSQSPRFSDRCGQKFREWSMLLHLRLLLRCKWSLLLFRRWPTPS